MRFWFHYNMNAKHFLVRRYINKICIGLHCCFCRCTVIVTNVFRSNSSVQRLWVKRAADGKQWTQTHLFTSKLHILPNSSCSATCKPHLMTALASHVCYFGVQKWWSLREKKSCRPAEYIFISKCHFILFTNLDFKRIPHAKYVEHSTQTIRHLKSMNVGQYNSIPSIYRAMWRRVWRLSDMNIIVAYRSCSYSFIIVSALDLLLQNCRHEPHTSFITANLIALAHIITTNKCQALPILPN